MTMTMTMTMMMMRRMVMVMVLILILILILANMDQRCQKADSPKFAGPEVYLDLEMPIKVKLQITLQNQRFRFQLPEKSVVLASNFTSSMPPRDPEWQIHQGHRGRTTLHETEKSDEDHSGILQPWRRESCLTLHYTQP